MRQQMMEQFTKLFNTENDIRTFFAPGRVNLIGEHTDYNGGHVFPCALTFGTYALVALRNDQKIQMYSMNFPDVGIISFSIDEGITFKKEHDWANYPKGVIKEFVDKDVNLGQGFDVLFYGNIPNGAGLSSSASIELATAVILQGIYETNFATVELVKMSQHAENEFIGVSCGIMDQFAIGMGKENNAILLNCQSLEYQYSPILLKDASLVIANTNKRRTLADSKYNERRSECERALEDLQKELPIQSLGDLTPEQFESNRHLIQNEIDQKRAKHAVYENARTIQAVEKLQEGDISSFGKLMCDSHTSLRDDYEVTGFELDTLVEAAMNQAGVIGSRMTGAGFGGCTVSIVENDKIEAFIEEVGKSYNEKTGLTAEFYVASVGDGAKELK
ncbi:MULTISPECIES: galactokinase [Metabacillus]|uniref:Galactokinase n=2 Tax=Metabacillus TaxID=2675233 RepID=A0A179SMN6_9BACI|nr:MULTISPECIES: galactokinase [Metabacillus]OAS82985.1 galactokinase [Metabacillus litoralis]QNF27540.1 galactokinase [Metabacillus sp. KUDC1714]